MDNFEREFIYCSYIYPYFILSNGLIQINPNLHVKNEWEWKTLNS